MKFFMVTQVSDKNSTARMYADTVYCALMYCMRGKDEFVESGASSYVGQAWVPNVIRDIKNLTQKDVEYFLERHDLDNSSSDLHKDLMDRLTQGYDGYIVLLDTDEEYYDDSKHKPVTNGNVYYEYGILMSNTNRVVPLKLNNTELPWDVYSLNSVEVPRKLIEYVMGSSREKGSCKSQKEIMTSLSECDDELKRELWKFFVEFLKFFAWTKYHVEEQEKYSDFKRANEFLKTQNLTFSEVVDRTISMLETLDAGELLRTSMAEYFDTEQKAFEKLAEAVKGAKRSIRTTRFANQSIVDVSHKEDSPANTFMEELFNATKQNKNLLCERIVCNNHPDKWWDIEQTLEKSGPNMKIYVYRQQYDINFEIVVIDEETTFLHFYQSAENEHRHGEDEVGERNGKNVVRKIRSTLRITNKTVGEEFAKIFDRLHHRDRKNDILSRRLLQVEGDWADVERNDFRGMCLSMENSPSPITPVRVGAYLLSQWEKYAKGFYEFENKKKVTYQEKVDFANITIGLYRDCTENEKGCGMCLYNNEELEKAYEKVTAEGFLRTDE